VVIFAELAIFSTTGMAGAVVAGASVTVETSVPAGGSVRPGTGSQHDYGCGQRDRTNKPLFMDSPLIFLTNCDTTKAGLQKLCKELAFIRVSHYNFSMKPSLLLAQSSHHRQPGTSPTSSSHPMAGASQPASGSSSFRAARHGRPLLGDFLALISDHARTSSRRLILIRRFLTFDQIHSSYKSAKRPSNLGQNAQALLDSPEAGTSPRRVLTVLINELAEQINAPLSIVLDDYHFITSPVVHQLVDFLLESAPPSLQLIISTRTDPPLSLARLRAHGLLAELRANDLRFRDDEVACLLQREVPDLPADSLTLLCEKTEGWVAALQIICNSLAGQNPEAARAMVSSLSGSHRFVFEYFAEVFRRQSEETQRFLLHTSILAQMDAASCNAVARVRNAQDMLEELENQNLFLTSLDVERHWYRYHLLFREFLLSRLSRAHGAQVSELEGHIRRITKHKTNMRLPSCIMSLPGILSLQRAWQLSLQGIMSNAGVWKFCIVILICFLRKPCGQIQSYCSNMVMRIAGWEKQVWQSSLMKTRAVVSPRRKTTPASAGL
jgi:hypothetical protein